LRKVLALLAALALVAALAAGAHHVAAAQALMFGPVPQPVEFENPLEILVLITRLILPPQIRPPSGEAQVKHVPPPQTVGDIDDIHELVAFCNENPDLVNEMIERAAREYGYSVPGVTCQFQLTTTGPSGTVKTTWFFENGRFVGVEYGHAGDNVKARLLADEGFVVEEAKLFLSGNFKEAEDLARENFGIKYRILYVDLSYC